MKQLIPLLITILLISCGGAKTEKKQPAPKKDQPAVQRDNSVDSICMANILMEAIDTARLSMPAGRFKKEFVTICDSLYNVYVSVTMDHFFSPNEKHLIVHLRNPDENMYNIYLVRDKDFIKVASHTEGGSGEISDTLQDINGDGINDYFLNWYGSSGCCLRNIFAVFIYQPQNGTFSNEYFFINATFSPKEKLIRGVRYGHPGETKLYKYKWNGLQVDTLEFIYFEKNKKEENTGKVIREKILNNNTETSQKERLNQIPAEYRHIYGYDWFRGK